MIRTIPRRGRKQPKWDPSQNRQKQPLPKPKTARKCQKQPNNNKKQPQNNRKPLKTTPPMGATPPFCSFQRFSIVVGLCWVVFLLLLGCFATFSSCFGFWKGLFLTILTGIPFWEAKQQMFYVFEQTKTKKNTHTCFLRVFLSGTVPGAPGPC